jgi:hypothetical protein
VGPGFFPLDDQLGLLPGQLTPRLQEALVRLSTWIPSFAKAAAELAWFTQVEVHPDTARRLTEVAGAVVVELETVEASRLLDEPATPVEGPERLVVSVDGAMVPLVGGQWAEVRTLVVGEAQPAVMTPDGPVIPTTKVSYFSRLSDSTTFADQALPELQRRGIETAGQVGLVVDGAEWCQSFSDLHYPEAVRILDFAHAAGYVRAIGQTVGPQGPLLSVAEQQRLLHDLKHSGPERVLAELHTLVTAHPGLADLASQLAYLDKREAQLQYPTFHAAGWPIGSGMVESANKLVVEDRLKGAGMHWADGNVNPLLALRNAVCNDRWVEVWSGIEAAQRQQVQARQQARRQRRQASVSPAEVDGPTAAASGAVAPVTMANGPQPPPVAQPKSGRPAADHPWRKAWSVRRQRELADAA